MLLSIISLSRLFIKFYYLSINLSILINNFLNWFHPNQLPNIHSLYCHYRPLTNNLHLRVNHTNNKRHCNKQIPMITLIQQRTLHKLCITKLNLRPQYRTRLRNKLLLYLSASILLIRFELRQPYIIMLTYFVWGNVTDE